MPLSQPMIVMDADGAAAVADSQPEPLRAVTAPDVERELPPFEALYREHFEFVWRLLQRLGVPRRDLEDQLQEVFKVVLVTRGRYDGRTAPRAWLFGIARNVSRTYRRSVRRKGIFDPLPDVLPDAGAVTAERAASTRQDVGALARILESLDDDLRDVFIMTEFLDMTAREIGEALGLPPNTVSSRLRRAWAEVERKAALARKGAP